MVIDTSAVIAIVKREPGYQALVRAIVSSSEPKISAATVVELQIVMSRGLGLAANTANEVLAHYGIRVVPFDESQMKLACLSHATYGVGSGSKAKLNLGDCFSYALATQLAEPLLYVGEDFTHTDVIAAV